MGIRREWPIVGAAVLLSTMTLTVRAQTPTQAAPQTDNDETPITLVGCLQREADYRRTNDSGRGGVAGSGVGRGNEYVLINASRDAATQTNIDCSSLTSGESYELTGNRERDLEPFVGRVVQISGMLKEADTRPVGTSGRAEPTGGFDPLGQDLRLHEVNVSSFQEVTTATQAPAATAEAPAAIQPAAAAEPTPAAEPQPTATTGAEQLPRTASPLPIAGLLGLLSLGGALGIRALRRR